MISLLSCLMRVMASEHSKSNTTMICGIFVTYNSDPFDLKISLNGIQTDIPGTSKYVYKKVTVNSSNEKESNEINPELQHLNIPDDDISISKIYDKRFVLSAFAIKKPLYNDLEFDLKSLKKIGHRGSGKTSYKNNTFIENTLNSFLEARSKGADMVELDVHLTSDNFVVVYHNDDIDGKKINSMSFQEFIKNSSEKLVSSDPKNRFTTLEEILNSIPEDLGINIEIKADGFNSKETESDEYLIKLIRATIDIAQRHRHRFFYTSFSPQVCILLKMINENFKVGFLICDEIFEKIGENSLYSVLNMIDQTVNPDAYIMDTKFYFQHVSYANTIFNFKRFTFCYGEHTNNIEDVKFLFSKGFNGFISDDIAVLNELF